MSVRSLNGVQNDSRPECAAGVREDQTREAGSAVGRAAIGECTTQRRDRTDQRCQHGNNTKSPSPPHFKSLFIAVVFQEKPG